MSSGKNILKIRIGTNESKTKNKEINGIIGMANVID